MHQSSLKEFAQFGTRIFWIGLWDGPNVMAIGFLFGIALCLENIFKNGANILAKLLYAISVFFLSYGVYLTKSRGGMLAYILIITTFFMLRFSKKKAFLILCVTIPLFLFSAPSRMKMINSEESSAHLRTWLWEQGITMMRSNPMFGIGKGEFYKHVSSRIISHSNYVSNMAEMGFTGLLIYLALFYWAFKVGFMIFKQAAINQKNELMSVARMLLITLVGFCVATAFVEMEHDILYVLLAMFASLAIMAKREMKNIDISLHLPDGIKIFGISVMVVFIHWLVAVKEII
jgi:O-antigen ligase